MTNQPYPKELLRNLSYRIAHRWVYSSNEIAKAGRLPERLTVLMEDPAWIASHILKHADKRPGKGHRLTRPMLKYLRKQAKEHAITIITDDINCELGFLKVALDRIKHQLNSPRYQKEKAEREKLEATKKRWRLLEIKRSKNILGQRLTPYHLQRLRAGQTDTQIAKIREEILAELNRHPSQAHH